MSLHKSFVLKTLSIFLMAASLTGCGFQPLHGNRHTAQDTMMKEELARVFIKNIPDRNGQQLRNELLTLFNPKGEPKSPKYTLQISLSESTSGIGISKDDYATRANLNMTANFSFQYLNQDLAKQSYALNDLNRKNQGKSNYLGLSGTSQSVVSYNILTSPTGTEFAEADAQKRAYKNIAKDIYRRVAVHLLTAQKPTTN